MKELGLPWGELGGHGEHPGKGEGTMSVIKGQVTSSSIPFKPHLDTDFSFAICDKRGISIEKWSIRRCNSFEGIPLPLYTLLKAP